MQTSVTAESNDALDEPMRREFHRAMWSCVWERLPIRSPCKYQCLKKAAKEFFRSEKGLFLPHFDIGRSNRSNRPPLLDDCNVHPFDGIGIAFGRIRNRMCRCDSPWCRPNDREQHVESPTEVLSSPSDVHLWDLRIDRYTHIPRRHLCSTRIVHRRDIWYWHIDL